MALLPFYDVFNIGTGAVGTTVARTGYGFQPKAIICWWSGRTESTDTVGSASVKFGIGLAVSSTSFVAVTEQIEDNVATTNSDRRHTEAAVISVLTTAGGIDGEADVQSFDSDGVTFEITDQFATDIRVMCLALGGDDLTNAAIVQFLEPAATGDQDTTTVGFQPDAAFFLSKGQNDVPPATSANSLISFGAAAGVTPSNAVLNVWSQDSAADADTATYCRSGECIGIASTVANGRAAVTAWLSNGFRLNWSEIFSTGGRYCWALCLKGGRYAVGNLLTQTDTVTAIVESELGFTPKAVLFASGNRAEDAADTPTANGEWSIGAAVSTSSRGAQGYFDEDATASSESTTAIEHDQVYVNMSAADAISGLMDIQSFDLNGFTCIMDDADSAQAFVWYMAMGSGLRLLPITGVGR